MADIIVGEKVINKLGEIGTIISYDDKFISIQYQNRVGKLQSNAFEAGYVKYQNSNLQSKIDESAQQIKNKKEQEAEERRLAAQKAKEACEKMESMAPVGVKFNSVSIRLEPATVSLSSVRSKHRKLAQEVFDECDKDIGTFYEAFKPRMKYITPPPTPTRASHFLDYVNEPKDVRPSYFRSRYCAGFLAKYGEVYVLRVLSRNDVYTPGMVGGFTVTNSDTTEILRILCIDGEIYYFSKNLSCENGNYKNSTLYKKWQATSFVGLVSLDEVIKMCDCNYLNEYIEGNDVNCLNYVKLLMAALYNNKAEIVFKHKLFSSIADMDNICDYLEDFSSKQIDFASKNNVINSLPIIKECGLFEVDILEKIEALMKKGRNGSSTYNNLVQFFTQRDLDASGLNKKLVDFLRKDAFFDPAIYGDYIIEISRNPYSTIDDVFDKDYVDRHYNMIREKKVFYSSVTSNQYERVAMELSWIDREENGHHIIVPKKISEFKHEGQMQHNCVYTMEYFLSVIDHESIIVFLRESKDTPYVTIEFDYNTFEVRQAYGKYNQRIDSQLYNYIVDLGKRLNYERLSRE